MRQSATPPAQGDADGDLDVEGADVLTWQPQLKCDAAVSAIAAVPDPAALLLALVAASAWLRRH